MMAHVFAYGSNINARQMASRCPGAKIVAVGTMERHRLAFFGQSSRWDGGVASVVPADARSVVRGVIWRMSLSNLARLDSFEGFPFAYDRYETPILVKGRRSPVWCHTYIKITETERETLPSEIYLQTIIQGMHAAGIRPPRKLENMLRMVSQ